MSRRHEDFEVKECDVRVYYVEEMQGWSWRCSTCDTSTQVRKHGKHLHKLESDAVVGSKYHRNAKRLARQQKRWRAWWYHELFLITDVDAFEQHWRSYWWDSWTQGKRTREEMQEIMNKVQSDETINNIAKKYWKEDQKEYGNERI